MARLIKNVEVKDLESENQFVIVHSQRFNKAQWDHLKRVQQESGYPIPAYIRRLVDADRKKPQSVTEETR